MGKVDRERKLRKAIAQLTEFYSAGATDEEAQELLGVTDAKFIKLKKALYDQETERLSTTPTEHVYVQYVINQIGCIRDLNELYKACKSQKNSNAGVGAIRARSEIFDKIIKTGQEFGVLEKKPEEKRIVAGVLVAQLSNVQLRQSITSALGDLNEMVSTFGNLDITQVTPGQLHYALPELAEKADKTNRARTSKVSGGRRVVKTPIT